VTSALLWLAMVTVVWAGVSGIAWANSRKARARLHDGAKLYWAIFLSGGWFVFLQPAMNLSHAIIDEGREWTWLGTGIGAVAVLTIFLVFELAFKPTRTLAAAYAQASSHSGETR
jgi:hypothetical protein